MYELPELPYGYDALEPHVSREALELHHGAHHAAYVKGANETLRKLEAARKERDFGDFAACKEQLTAAAAGVQGSGWGALSWEPLGQRLLVEQVYDHQGNTGNSTVPILVVDMWEHAYYLQYRNKKASWLEAYWQVVNWNDVAERLTKVRK